MDVLPGRKTPGLALSTDVRYRASSMDLKRFGFAPEIGRQHTRLQAIARFDSSRSPQYIPHWCSRMSQMLADVGHPDEPRTIRD